ncbi:hypothetical protein EIP86_010958 [Pleurotus ostreatoroseus]|nr:hypothetical protein EIP86_010958 [Pleurotus ostreatoroseus]
MQFLAPKALSFVQSSLGSEYDKSLGPAAPWADDVRDEKAYAWSAPLHFVDAEVTAIANYTVRVAETSLSATQRQEALKFLDHAVEVGGNDIDAKCSGSSTNLHAAWDTGILTKNVDANHGSEATTYATYLAGQITSGEFESLTSSWLSCTSITEPVSARSETPTIESDIGILLANAKTSAAITPLDLRCSPSLKDQMPAPELITPTLSLWYVGLA